MIKKLMKSIREYKKDSLLSPAMVTLEVIMEDHSDVDGKTDRLRYSGTEPGIYLEDGYSACCHSDDLTDVRCAFR